MPPPTTTRWAAMIATLLAATWLVLTTYSHAQRIDPSTPTVVAIGLPAGYAVRDRLDDRRSGQSPTRLPTAPRALWRRELAGGLLHPPLVDDDGDLVALLASADVLRLDPEGKRRWRVRLPGGAPTAPPVLSNDGALVAVTSDGYVQAVDRDGALRFRTALGAATKRADVSPLALADGSIVVATERGLVHIDADGAVRARVDVPGHLSGGLLGADGATLATTQDGQLIRWRPPGPAQRLGRFGGRLAGGALLSSARTAVAVVEQNRIVALDLRSGTTRVIADAPSLAPLEPTLTLSPDGRLLATSVVGELLAFNRHGALVQHSALENTALLLTADAGSPTPSIFRRLQTKPSPATLADAFGSVAFARTSGRIAVRDHAGAIREASARFCATPLALMPAGDGRMVVACRGGSLGMFGE